VIEWVPLVVKVILNEAVPLAPTVAVAPAGVTFAVPRLAVPSLNVTVPVGPCALLLMDPMVADKVTCWLVGTGFALAATDAVVAVGVTVTVSVTAVVTGL
jgi:hypothetical protein